MPPTSPLNGVREFRIVTHRLLATNEHGLLLEWNGQYAVCRTQPARSMALALNYDNAATGILTSPLTFRGLKDLLNWVDKPTADLRFSALLKAHGMPALHLCAVPG